MKLAGEAVLHAPIDRVWTALRDPAVLVATIPGCERLVATGPDSYDMTVTAGVASIKGSYAGTVSLTDLPEPHTFLMKASGAGGPGTVNADVRVSLSEASQGTRLVYDADAVIGGVIGGVGQRMLIGVAKKLAGEFFSGVDDVLTGNRPAAAAAPVQQGAGGQSALQQGAGQPAAVGQQAGPAVFTAAAGGKPARPAPESFFAGAVFGAVTALLGVLVGARTARASQNSRTARRMG